MRRALLVLLVLLMVTSGLVPLLNGGTASAVAVTQRSLTITTGVASATANYTFAFTPGSTTQIQSIFFQACTTALGACSAPAGINLSGGTVTQGGFQGATSFAKDTATSSPVACNVTTNLCAKRTDATAQTITAHSIIDTGAVNQNNTNCGSVANCTFFVRISTFSDNAYTTAVDSGTVASSTTATLTISATIQEVLTFCVGATTIDDSNTSTPPACASVSGTSLNLGTMSSANTSVSPVTVGNGGDGNNGIAELSTNATNGATVGYDAIQQAGTNHKGTLRVSGATCNAGAINTDQCINAIGTTQAAIVAGTEAYGLTIAAVNCKATTAYACSFTSGTYNLIRDTNYDGTGSNTYPTDTNLVSGTTNAGYAWDETGTDDTIATSTTVVDKEAMILKFAATPNVVTPTGSYTAKADFVATPTF